MVGDINAVRAAKLVKSSAPIAKQIEDHHGLWDGCSIHPMMVKIGTSFAYFVGGFG